MHSTLMKGGMASDLASQNSSSALDARHAKMLLVLEL